MLKAVGHRVMVKPREVKKTTASGIAIVLDEKIEKSATVIGTVVGVGPDAWKTMYITGTASEPWAKVGDEVYYAKYAGKWVIDEDTQTEYLIINDEDITAVISK